MNKTIEEYFVKFDGLESGDLKQLKDVIEDFQSNVALPEAGIKKIDRVLVLINKALDGNIDQNKAFVSIKTALKELNFSLNDLKQVSLTESCCTSSAESLSNNQQPTTNNQLDCQPEQNVEYENFDAGLSPLIDIFTVEASDRLETLEAWVIEFDKQNPEALDAIKRTIHTYKGEFGLLDLHDYVELIHFIESELIKNNVSTKVMLAFVDTLRLAVSLVKDMKIPRLSNQEIEFFGLKNINNNTTEHSDSDNATDNDIIEAETDLNLVLQNDANIIADFFDEVEQHLESAETILVNLTDFSHIRLDDINTIFRAFHSIKGSGGLLALDDFVKITHIAEDIISKLRDKKNNFSEVIKTVTLDTIDVLRELKDSLKQSLEQGVPFSLPDNYSVVYNDLLNLQKESQNNAKIGQKKQDKKQNINAQLVNSKKTFVHQESIRVPVDRLSHIINLIGETVISQSQVTLSVTNKIEKLDNIHKEINTTNNLLKELQEYALKLRMVTLAPIFQKMKRLVYDLSSKLDKQVNFITTGEDTEIDKSIVEKISDPLMHIMRNAMDHGLETQEERLNTGKDKQGTITLSAYHSADSVVIEIKDDGRGLDTKKILAKAVEKGIVDAGKNYSQEEIFDFLFLPGFSTAAKVTDVSGRGVGMDVVKRSIESLSGTLKTSSTLGHGSTFTIILPLTMAITDGMVIALGENRFIIPILSIVESFDIEHHAITSLLGKGKTVKLRGKIYPYLPLSEFTQTEGKIETIILIEDQLGSQFALGVTGIVGEQQVLVKNLGLPHGLLTEGVSGGIIMGDGRVRLILDITAIHKWMKQN